MTWILNLKEVATAWIVNSGLPANILQIFCKYFAWMDQDIELWSEIKQTMLYLLWKVKF